MDITFSSLKFKFISLTTFIAVPPPAEPALKTSPKVTTTKQGIDLSSPNRTNPASSSNTRGSNVAAGSPTQQTASKTTSLGSVASRVEATAPFRMMLTRVDHVGDEDGAVTFADLLDPSLGTIAASLQVGNLASNAG